MKLIFSCPICHKKSHIKSESVLGDKKFILLDCNHCYTEKIIDKSNEINPILHDGRLLYEFQKAGVEFIRKSDFRCLLADEMGLGKTIQIVSALANHPELLPALVIVKASLKIQWMRELFNGAGLLSQILESRTTALVDPRFTCYIASYDSIKNATWKEKLKFNTLILDECQQIKNHDSKRTQAVRDIAKDVRYLLSASGTPIKNNAGEYFPILNLLRPNIFYAATNFYQQYTNSYRTGFGWKVGGLRNPSQFKSDTKDFIIRRTRKEVLPDLPTIRRSYRYTDMNELITKKYKGAAADLQDYLLNSEEKENSSEHILAMMNRLRHLTGLAKVETVLDYVDEFLENEEGEKLTIFHHHLDVAELLMLKLGEREGLKIFQIKSTMSPEDRAYVVDAFKDHPGAAVLLAPTLACGEGINLQFCSHVVIIEREWSPATEEQAEGRFSRIGNAVDSIEVIYPVAIGSIDEMFAEYVERKRQYLTEAYEGKAAEFNARWNQSQIIKDITEQLIKGGHKPFRISSAI